LKYKPFHDLSKTVIKGLVGLCLGELLHASEDLRSAEQEWKNEKNEKNEKNKLSKESEKKTPRYSQKGRLFIPEIYSVATCPSSQKNVIMRCARYVAWKPNDSGRV